MSDENNNGRNPPPPGGRQPLTLKPRGAGSVSAGTVKQSFSHGRSKTVVVETKRARTHVPGGGNLAAPSSAEKRLFEPRPAPPPAAPRPAGAPNDGLSAEERAARQRAIDAAQERQAAERHAAEASAPAPRPPPAAARPAAGPAAGRRSPAAPAAEAPAAAGPRAPRRSAAGRRRRRLRPPPRRRRRARRRPPPRPPRRVRPRQPATGQTRTYQPSADRRDDRPSTTTYRPGPPAARGGGPKVGPRAPRPDDQRAPRDDRGPPRRDDDRGPRPAAPGGDTVRYSALAPRPAGPRPGGPGGAAWPGGPRIGPAAPPATPEIQRATRQAPRPGGAAMDRRPDDDDRRRATNDPSKAISRAKGAPTRREGRLTIQAVAGDDEGAVDRMRSLASVRRAREREREKRKGGSQEQARAAREVVIPDVITVGELANRMAIRGAEIIKFLMRQGVMLKSGDVIDNDTAELVATEFGHTVRRVSEADVEEGFIGAEDVDDHLVTRPPVVTIMGHVDHGKTSLLDALRATDVVSGEHGGITQHIGAYQVHLPDGQRVTFLDTPGHAAFSAMRMRGATVTDIVVLVVAADDGVMPQTIEAINHAKAAGAPIIVAINKMDKPGADPTRVINELLQHEIVVESLGGDTQAIEVSAKEKTGLDNLLEAILLQAEVLDLKANPDRIADGVVIEAKLDRGRGAVSTVLVKRGTLRRGDIVVAGDHWGKVRALLNEREEQVNEAGPSVPVEILGLDGTPAPGDPFAVVENEARARELTAYRVRVKREKAGAPAQGNSLAEMMAKITDKKASELPLVIKADVQGSTEAIVASLDKIGTDEVRARIILSGAGAISESDVMLAKGANSAILGFNVRASKQARDLAEREGVEIRYYAIIYDLLDDIKGVLSGMLAPIQRETFLGNAEVLQAFDISKIGRVAGCRVTEGVVRKGARVRIIRDDIVVLELGTLQTLKRFKDEVNEVQSGTECGMAFAGFQDIKTGDVIECFSLEEVKRTL